MSRANSEVNWFQVAWHEAGHAVVAFETGLPLKSVWIGRRGTAEEGMLGGFELDDEQVNELLQASTDQPRDKRVVLRKIAMVALAGTLADVRFNGLPEDALHARTSRDLMLFNVASEEWEIDDEERVAMLEVARIEAANMFATSEFRRRVDWVCRGLVKQGALTVVDVRRAIESRGNYP